MNYLNESEINIEKDRELTKKLIIQYPSSIIQMFIGYAVLFLINKYFNLSDNTLFKIITYLFGGGICIKVFMGLLSMFSFLITFSTGIYGRIFVTEHYGLANKHSLLNELMNIVFIGTSVYVIWLILQLTNSG
tara:strand:- start:104 stop:502 length:399 start_codon:yes stop_codon:yes gene_type:complete